MTLTELRYIVAVAREQHFGRAAEACFVSQPTLSVAIRKLEDELGVTLFERRPNHVALTPIGKQVVQQAQRALQEADAVKQIAAMSKDQLALPLRLGVIYTIGPYLLPHLVPRLRELAPNMALRLEENFTWRLTEMLQQGELDVIIISKPFSETGLVTMDLYDEPFMVALPPGHPWESRESIDPGEIAQENMLLLGAGHCFRDQVIDTCPDVNRSRTAGTAKTLEGGSLETIRYMVASGAGISILPCTSVSNVNPAHNLLVIRPFHAPAPVRRVALAWRKSFPRPDAIAVLEQAIRACQLPCVQYLESRPED
jgi:LysR family transcriptional regulator, hydrogen peroxide-inducible genes activator